MEKSQLKPPQLSSEISQINLAEKLFRKWGELTPNRKTNTRL